MGSLQEYMEEYRKQLKKGAIQEAYKGLMAYIMSLRTHFSKKYPDCFVSGNIYYGYMDMTYFSFTSKSLRDRKLKIAIVFTHETFRFEIWLAGANKGVQSKYWKLIKENGWNKYILVPTTESVDSIIEYVAVEDPDFGDLGTLTNQIETASLKFIEDVEYILPELEN